MNDENGFFKKGLRQIKSAPKTQGEVKGYIRKNVRDQVSKWLKNDPNIQVHGEDVKKAARVKMDLHKRICKNITDPKNPHYVADSEERKQKVSDANKEIAEASKQLRGLRSLAPLSGDLSLASKLPLSHPDYTKNLLRLQLPDGVCTPTFNCLGWVLGVLSGEFRDVTLKFTPGKDDNESAMNLQKALQQALASATRGKALVSAVTDSKQLENCKKKVEELNDCVLIALRYGSHTFNAGSAFEKKFWDAHFMRYDKSTGHAAWTHKAGKGELWMLTDNANPDNDDAWTPVMASLCLPGEAPGHTRVMYPASSLIVTFKAHLPFQISGSGKVTGYSDWGGVLSVQAPEGDTYGLILDIRSSWEEDDPVPGFMLSLAKGPTLKLIRGANIEWKQSGDNKVWPLTVFLKDATSGEEIKARGQFFRGHIGSISPDSLRMFWNNGGISGSYSVKLSDLQITASLSSLEDVKAKKHPGSLCVRMDPSPFLLSDLLDNYDLSNPLKPGAYSEFESPDVKGYARGVVLLDTAYAPNPTKVRFNWYLSKTYYVFVDASDHIPATPKKPLRRVKSVGEKELNEIE